MRWWWALSVVVLGACAPKQIPPPAASYPERQAWADKVDWPAAHAEATTLLSSYLQVPTVNPPGQEKLGADFLAAWLAKEGIEAEVDEFLPGRANLIARLGSGTDAAPLCLLSHLDVVTAEVDQWERGPFSGEVDEAGYIWGRGALDMKSIGVAELMSFVLLKRLGVPLQRDVILLAVADEEVDNLGVKHLAEKRWAELRCGHVFNEGGLGLVDPIVEDLPVFAVSFTEKGALWLKLVATGEPGHGSTPLPDSAPARLMDALERLRRYNPKPTIHPELSVLLQRVGQRAGGLTGAVLRSPGLTRTLAAPQLMENPLTAAILTNTINVTGFGGANEPNVVPGEVWAQLDVRLLPGVTAADMIAELRELVGAHPWLRIDILSSLEAVESPTDDPVYRAIEENLQRAFPDAAVGPLIMPGTTDSQVLRPLGARCYGVGPFLVTLDDMRGFHGHNERIHRDVLGRGTEVMFRIVLDVVAGSAVGVGG